jgi:hypothetical protein
MKIKRQELDVDFIQSRPLTKEEEKNLSEYIKKQKNKTKKLVQKKAA